MLDDCLLVIYANNMTLHDFAPKNELFLNMKTVHGIIKKNCDSQLFRQNLHCFYHFVTKICRFLLCY